MSLAEDTPGNQSPPPTYNEQNDAQNTPNWTVLFSQPLDGMRATPIIEYKTRLEPLRKQLAAAMYAPIIYQMHLTLKLTPLDNASLLNPEFVQKWNSIDFIIANARVVNGDKITEEVTKQGKPIMSGNVNVSLTRQKTTNNNDFVFFGHTKIQFQDCSYHHNRIPFKLEWRFHLPNELTRPILQVVSTSFHVYARKPNKKRKDIDEQADLQVAEMNGKRKRSENEKVYEMNLTKRGQQDGGAVPQVDLTLSESSSPVNAHLPIEAQPWKKRKLHEEENRNGLQRERDTAADEKEFQERLAKLLECVKSRKNMSCVQVVISSMMNVASEMYREAHIN